MTAKELRIETCDGCVTLSGCRYRFRGSLIRVCFPFAVYDGDKIRVESIIHTNLLTGRYFQVCENENGGESLVFDYPYTLVKGLRV